MATADKIKRNEGHARTQAREVVQREAANRDLQEKLRRIEILKGLVAKRFKSFNTTVTIAAIWTFVLGALFLTLAWYANDIFAWLLHATGFDAPKK